MTKFLNYIRSLSEETRQKGPPFNLATINNAEEHVWVYHHFGVHGGAARNLWIGLNDIPEHGNFAWVDGSTAAYRNWAALAPDQNPGNDAVLIFHPENSQGGKWGNQHPNLTTWERVASENSSPWRLRRFTVGVSKHDAPQSLATTDLAHCRKLRQFRFDDVAVSE